MQTRIGGLLVVTGLTLAFALGAGWAVVVGAVLFVFGGIVLAIAAEPMLELADQTTSADATAEAVERGPVRGRDDVIDGRDVRQEAADSSNGGSRAA